MARETFEENHAAVCIVKCSYDSLKDVECKCDTNSSSKLIQRKNGPFDTKSKKLIISCISVYYFIMSSAYSMLAPFFPSEAEKKGVKSAITGLIFAVFPLVIILLSPIIGFFIPILGVKFVLILGLILEGGSQIIFGFLDTMPNGTTFVIFAFLIRIVSGFGAATTSTASLTLLTETFQDDIASAMGIMELFSGFGLMAGPPIGGFLYAASGFKLPFLLIGSMALASLIPLYFILPADRIYEVSIKKGAISLLRSLKTPAILVIALSVAMAGTTLSFLDPTLEPHLKKPFNLDSSQVGLMFLIGPAAYALFSPFCGMIINRLNKRCVLTTGACICGFSYILLGPAPFLRSKVFPSSLWLNGISLALFGIGGAMFCVPALADMNDSAIFYGFGEAKTTKSALSSIYNSMFYFGGITGPILGGFLVEQLQFPWSSTIFGFLLCFVGLFVGIFTIWERKYRRPLNSKLEESVLFNADSEEVNILSRNSIQSKD